MLLLVLLMLLIMVVYGLSDRMDINIDIYKLEDVHAFKTYILTYSLYKSWPSLSLREKIPFLIDHYFLKGLHDDFMNFAISSEHGYIITKDKLIYSLEEFQPLSTIENYFSDCDTDQNGNIAWDEYVICRGYYDKHGGAYGMSEYDYLENIIIHDFTTQLSDPNNPLALELIEKGEL
jgi:hypothetical protein